MWEVIVLVLLDYSCSKGVGVVWLPSALVEIARTYLEQLGRSVPDLST